MDSQPVLKKQSSLTVLLAALYGLSFIFTVLYLSGGFDDWALRRTEPPPPLPTAPNPSLTPEMVVRVQLEALRGNDEGDSGIATCFRFSSPANRELTGPLDRFAQMLKEGIYRVMLNHASAEFGPPRVRENSAEQPVLLTDPSGDRWLFLFRLSRQEGGEYDGCWMTDSVMFVPPDQAPEPPEEVNPVTESAV